MSVWDAKREVGIVNGAHQAQEMQDQLFGFVELFILCPQCSFPELVHKVKKSSVGAKCYSCGWVGGIRSAHKIMKYVTNHPPAKSSRPRGADKSKKQRRAEREQARLMKKQNAPAGAKSKTNQEETESAPKDVFGDLSQWHMDPDSTKMEAERARERAKEEEFRLHHSNVAPDTPVALMKFVLSKPNVKLIDIVSEFERIKIAHKLEEQEVKLGKVLVDAVFDFTTIEAFIESIGSQNLLLGWYASDATRASILMSYIEEAIVSTDYWKYTSMIFEEFYDQGIYDERFFVSWYNQPPENSYVVKDPEDIQQLKQNVKPFIEWVMTFCPEEEGDDDVDIEYDGGENPL